MAVWLAILLPLLAWSMQMGARYALQPWICARGEHVISNTFAAVAVIVALAGGLIAWRTRRRTILAQVPSNNEVIRARARFMASLGWGCVPPSCC
jgi:hypothetical protein